MMTQASDDNGGSDRPVQISGSGRAPEVLDVSDANVAKVWSDTTLQIIAYVVFFVGMAFGAATDHFLWAAAPVVLYLAKTASAFLFPVLSTLSSESLILIFSCTAGLVMLIMAFLFEGAKQSAAASFAGVAFGFVGGMRVKTGQIVQNKIVERQINVNGGSANVGMSADGQWPR